MSVKIMCGQIEVIAGRPDINTKTILTYIDKAIKENADILLLPELCISGSFIGDLWEQEAFLCDCAEYGEDIIKATENSNLCVIFGNVAIEANPHGRLKKYNAAFVVQNGKLIKQPNSTYDFIISDFFVNKRSFDSSRYFTSLTEIANELGIAKNKLVQPIEINTSNGSVKIGVLPSDLNYQDEELLSNLKENGAEIILNLTSTPYCIDNENYQSSAEMPIVICNSVGVQNTGKNILTFAGQSRVYDKQNKLIAQANSFNEDLLTVEFDCETHEISSKASVQKQPQSRIEKIYAAIKFGAKKFLEQCGITKMVVGLSGGIDSGVTATLYTDILGPKNVLLINMPSRYNSYLTKSLAERTAKALKTNYAVLPISESVRYTVKQLSETPVKNFSKGTDFNLNITPFITENIQARDRGARILAGAAAAFGGAFSCNGNKTESTIGYATFYGDIAGALAAIGDLWKHDVYALGRYLNEVVFEEEVIPQEMFDMHPSAELSFAQTVGNGGDPLVYEYHDKLFAAFVESNTKTSPEEILTWYIDKTLGEKIDCPQSLIDETFPTASDFIADLERWWKLFAGFAVAKRIQAPPMISISARSFGTDNREAQLSPYFSRKYLQLKSEVLNSD